MAASYPTSVKSFSAKVNGDLIAATHVTDLEAEVVAIETALLGTLAGPLSLAEGRLTLTSGTPVTTADVSAAATAYYTPYIGNGISLYDGSTAWAKYTFTEITISLVGLTASKPYDIFAYNSSGTVTIETLVWTSATARATALAYQNGVLVKSGATTRRYLGTIYINSTGGQTDDTVLKRFVWNYYNRVPRFLRVTDLTDSWTYTTATWRQANAASANKCEVLIGVAEVLLDLRLNMSADNTSGDNNVSAYINIAEDSITAPTQGMGGHVQVANFNDTLLGSWLMKYPVIGYHYYAWLEWSTAAGTTTWRSDNGNGAIGAEVQSGILGMIQG